jgi:hypothetical protein
VPEEEFDAAFTFAVAPGSEMLTKSTSLVKLNKQQLALLEMSSMQSRSDYEPDLGVSPVLFSQLSLPHSRPAGDPEVWSRSNGSVTMKVFPNLYQDPLTGEVERQYPFGIHPRLIIAYMTTEATKTQSRTISLGDSLRQFTIALGLGPGGTTGKAVRKQFSFLLGSSIRFEGVQSTVAGEQRSEIYFSFADARHEFTPAPGTSHGSTREWLNEINLSERFYAEVASRAVPIDLNVLRALNSAMSIDAYLWVSHRIYSVKNTVRIKWEDLRLQFGAGYSDHRRFRSELKDALDQVAVVYEGLRFDSSRDDYLMLYPSPTAIPRAIKR